MFRVGLYARVSTNDQQTIPMQIRALREYAAKRGWTVVVQAKEIGSGASQRQLREQLREAARRREIDVVLVPDANGLVGTRYDYLPFGEEVPAGTGARTAAMGYAYSENYFNPKFVGQMRDPESARDYMQSGITVRRRGGL